MVSLSGWQISICRHLRRLSSLSGARVPFAAARDRLFFTSVLGHIQLAASKTPLTPASSCKPSSARSCCSPSESFQALFSLAIFADWVFYALTASTIFIFRRRDRTAGIDRPFTMWGYPALPAIFILAAAVLTVFSFADQPRNSIAGAAIILLGIPAHLILRRHNRHAPEEIAA